MVKVLQYLGEHMRVVYFENSSSPWVADLLQEQPSPRALPCANWMTLNQQWVLIADSTKVLSDSFSPERPIAQSRYVW
jgi:hypothetical protein